MRSCDGQSARESFDGSVAVSQQRQSVACWSVRAWMAKRVRQLVSAALEWTVASERKKRRR